MFSALSLSGWYVGFIVTICILAIVVTLVSMILTLARRIDEQAIAIEASLQDSRVRTLALWDVSHVNEQLNQIVRRAATARSILGSKL